MTDLLYDMYDYDWAWHFAYTYDIMSQYIAWGWVVYLEEVYRTDKVARVAQDDCGPTDGYMPFILLAALL